MSHCGLLLLPLYGMVCVYTARLLLVTAEQVLYSAQASSLVLLS